MRNLSRRDAPTLLYLFAALTLLSPACAGPTAAMQLSPAGHGQHSRAATPRPIAWRSNALSAPCALECKDKAHGGGIACSCGHGDSIYIDHQEEASEARAQHLRER